jgi:hypothetical protein
MSPALRLPRDRILALDPSDVEAYLLAHGWEPDRKASTPEAGVYHLPSDGQAEILLPRDKGFIDYALRVSEVLQAVAAAERRTAWEVLEDFTAQRAGRTVTHPAAGRRPREGAPGRAKRDAS